MKKIWKYSLIGSAIGLISAIIGDISIFIATKPLSIILLPFYMLINVMYMFYEILFGFQGEFGALDEAMILSLVIYPLIGALIGYIIQKRREK